MVALPGTQWPPMYAQTNIQLLDQLRREDYATSELTLVRDAYELARQLYTGYFIASGRTQIAHVVGTASILGSLHVPAEVVAAGLIHNVYETGDFGDGRRGSSDGRRRQIRQAIGASVEEHVYRFPAVKSALQSSSTHPHPRTISAIRDEPDGLDLVDRHVLLIVLADRLDHRRNLEYLNEYLNQDDHRKGEMAEELGFPALAAELKEACSQVALMEFYAEVPDQGRKHSGVIAPRSYRKRLWLVLRPKVRRSVGRVYSALGVRTGLGLLVRRVYRLRRP